MDLWGKVLEKLRKLLGEGPFTAWFSGSRLLEHTGDTFYIEVRDSTVSQWIESYYMGTLRSILESLGYGNCNIILKARKTQFTPPKLTLPPQQEEEDIEKRFTFDTFVVGKSNMLAHAAAHMVAQRPGRAYNPLFIYGGVGLGKTHLILAIKNYVRENYPSLKVLYVQTEKMMNELIQAIKNGTTLAFKERYRGLDVLLIDDIHFLSGKESLQEEFFHTFNELYNNKKQIVLTSDRPPKEMHALEERIRSRFEWGLVVDIQPPDFETRLAILKKKTELDNINIDDDILYYIASHVKDNIRTLEGCIFKILAYSSIHKQEIDLDTAREILRDIIKETTAEITIERIIKCVAEEFGISEEMIKGKRRKKEIVTARQVAMYLARELINMPLKEIGMNFGGKDHTTVLHAIEKIKRTMDHDIKLRKRVEKLMEKLEMHE